MPLEYEIVDVKWYNQLQIPQTIGIVLVKLEVGGYKAYIGTGHGISEEGDKWIIAAGGARMHEAPLLWPNIKEWAP